MRLGWFIEPVELMTFQGFGLRFGDSAFTGSLREMTSFIATARSSDACRYRQTAMPTINNTAATNNTRLLYLGFMLDPDEVLSLWLIGCNKIIKSN